MYLYLYDSFLNNKKYSNLLARVETRLTDLGVGGKIYRLSPLRNVQELMADEIRNGTKTVVVVGNDKTLNQVVNIAAQYNIVVGLIPVGPDNNIARILGIPEGEAACTVLSARIIEKIDLGKINNTYFLSGADIKDSVLMQKSNKPAIFGTSLKCDSQDIDGLESTGQIVVWLSENGVCVGGTQGYFKELTRNTYNIPSKTSGSAIMRKTGNFNQVLASMW